MALKDIVEGIKAAKHEMRGLAAASQQVAEINDQGGSPSGGPISPPPIPSGGNNAPINMTFVSNITAAPSISGGSAGGGGGGVGGASAEDEFLNFLRTRGIYDIKKANEQTLIALKAEFEFIVRKALERSPGLAFRKMGMG
jgi:hypothetical protein